ncbi:hypothetical protein [Chryseobacterium polytrichastri]|uniref:YD repeat-containing protein n=1 Tax=Chryseobacterium polytrichastri TaxID=1302687 RepID=A0A1M6TAL2_9FLAO|nr:hypothetical protein [Chryseobacterium polytrichastri]SHK54010.1 hypothetical protein SAMN05444267_100534 [Chryseobacterium polytrichastri]
MRKIYLLLLCILISNLYYSQSQTPNTGVIQPVPTAASLATYNNNPVSVQTGIPNISYPLISVPTNNKSVNINLGLNYHAGNTSLEQWVSNVGKGWSMLGSGVISKEIMAEFDEKYDDINYSGYKKNEFKDLYNFSTPEESGKFRIIRDTLNNTFKVVKLTPYTSKIKYDSVANPATLIINSFTVISNTGIKYKFDKYDLSRMNVTMGFSPAHGYKIANKIYRSAFYLSRILDENDKELVKYNYLKETKYVLGQEADHIIESENNRLSSIEIKDHGIIEINYSKNASLDKMSDPFNLDYITLKTSNNLFIKKYKFEYSAPIGLRILNSFNQVDANENIIEKYQFSYKDIYSPPLESGSISSNVLNKVQLPTGGTVEYNFDMVPYYYYDAIKTIPAPLGLYGATSFEKVNYAGKKYFFTVTTLDKEITIDATDVAALSGYTWGINFYKKVGNTFQLLPEFSIGVVAGITPNPDDNLVQTRIFPTGEYYAELSCDWNVNLMAPLVINAYHKVGEPTEEHIKTASTTGLPRIKNIKYFDLHSSTITSSSIPSRIEEYEYPFFDNPTESSGYYVEGGSLNDGMTAAAPSMIYKNVKVSNGNNTGYTKYYFKTPVDYPIQNEHFIPNYNLVRGGLLEKTEVYNTANQKLLESIFDYTIQDFDGPEYSLPGGFFQVKTVWAKEEKITSRNFFDSGFAETKKEVIKNSNNYAPNLEKVTSFDGSIQETAYQYALDKNNQKLIDANIIGIPLETTSIIKKNTSDAGKLISRAETKYDDPANKFPSSAVSYDTQNNLAEEVIFNRYDSKGNLEQYTTKEGIPVSMVWGYSKTQPIAKVEGATYDQISGYISDIVSKSDTDIDATSEQALVSALDTFRNLPALQNTQITTYVYDPLIGMKIMTPPAGIREYYKYDTAGRLEQVVDENGKLLRKNKYNYKH